MLNIEKEKEYATVCRMCGNLCGICVKVKDNTIVSIKGDPDSPISRGRICIKGRTAAESLYSDRRLKYPLKRNSKGEFEQISLEQAIKEISERLVQISKKNSSRSIGIWKGEGADFQQNEGLARRFASAIGTPNYFSNDTQCFSGRYIAHKLVYGDYLIPDVENSNLIICWGSNVPMSHMNTMHRIDTGRKKGAKLIVIDTMRTKFAKYADLFVQIKPGTDIYLAYYILNYIINNNLVNHDLLEEYSIGFESLVALVSKIDIDLVSELTGIQVDDIEKIVSLLRQSIPKICSIGGTGLEHQSNGVNTLRAITMIDAIVGAIDNRGGMLLPTQPHINTLTLYDSINLDSYEPIGAQQFPVLYTIRHECHTGLLMDQIISGRPYPIKALILTAGNPVLTNANTSKVKEALRNLELFVVKDLFLSETAELADYVLPAASYFEREEIFVDLYTQTIRLSAKCIDLGLQTEYEFFRDLSRNLGIHDLFPWETDQDLIRWILEKDTICIDALRNQPRGIVYAERKYFKYCEKERRFRTPSNKLEFSSSLLRAHNYEGVPIDTIINTDDEEFPFILSTGSRKIFFANSKNRDVREIYIKMPSGCLEICKADAIKLGVTTGDKIIVKSKTGSFSTNIYVVKDGELQLGYLNHIHGFLNENVNLVSNDKITDPLSGCPALKYIRVKLEKINTNL